jgi:hypothetical protein
MSSTLALAGSVTSLRRSKPVISYFSMLLAATLFCGVSIPAFAAGDEKPSAPAPASARPDRDVKVITNDDFDRMFPKSLARSDESRASEANAFTTTTLQDQISGSRAPRAARVPTNPDADPERYAARLLALSTELDSVRDRARSLREFRATGTGPNLTFGLQINAPCEGFTTDNAIEQLAIRSKEIEQEMDNIETVAQQNDVSSGALQHALDVLEAGPQPLSPAEQEAALRDKQSQLIGDLDAVHNELTGMANQASAQGMVLLPVTPNSGGNMTTNLLQNLDNRAGEIRSALDENADVAHRAGLSPSTLP